MKIILLIFSTLIFSSCNSKLSNKKENSKELFELIFADGFKSDEIIFALNGTEIIKTVLKSDESDGLASLEYKIVKRGEETILIKSYGDEKIYPINDDENIEISVAFNGVWYNLILDEQLGKYIIIDLNDSITFNQSNREPYFD